MPPQTAEAAGRFLEKHDDTIKELALRFGTYTVPVDHFGIRKWLKGFAPEDMDLALKLLVRLKYFSPPDSRSTIKAALPELAGTGLIDKTTRYLAIGAPGKSGSLVLRDLRLAAGMRSAKFDSQFITPSDFSRIYSEASKLVFVDDFVGSGDQILDYWQEVLSPLMPPAAEVGLLVLAGFDSAIDRVQRETGWVVHAGIELNDSHRLFHSSNLLFTKDEKDRLLGYCEEAKPELPGGYGDSQATIVFHHGIPDNSVPVLWCNSGRFFNLFPRSL